MDDLFLNSDFTVKIISSWYSLFIDGIARCDAVCLVCEKEVINFICGPKSYGSPTKAISWHVLTLSQKLIGSAACVSFICIYHDDLSYLGDM